MEVGVQEGVVLMLSVDLDELLSDALESGQRDRDAVDHRPASTRTHDLPADRDLALAILYAETESLEVESLRNIEDGLDRPFFLAGPHEITVGALTADKAEGIHHDRLPGPGFAGQKVQARAEFDLGGGHHREVFDAQDAKHKRAREGSMDASANEVRFIDPHKILCEPERLTTPYR